MTYEIVPCLPIHIREIRDRLRAGDTSVILCAGIDMRKAIWQSWKQSVMTKAVIVDGRVAAVWGCGGSPLSGVGYPWLLTALEIERIKVSFVREARIMVSEMLGVFQRLEELAGPEYTKAHRFLE